MVNSLHLRRVRADYLVELLKNRQALTLDKHTYTYLHYFGLARPNLDQAALTLVADGRARIVDHSGALVLQFLST